MRTPNGFHRGDKRRASARTAESPEAKGLSEKHKRRNQARREKRAADDADSNASPPARKPRWKQSQHAARERALREEMASTI